MNWILKIIHIFSRCILLGRSLKCRLIVKHIGKNFTLASYSIIGAPENVNIGNNVYINSHVSLNGQGGLSIWDDVLIGPYSSIWTSNHSFSDTWIPINRQWDILKSVSIENNVWIGASVVILPWVTVGAGSIIWAWSIVTKNIPVNSIAVWNPARVVRTRT